MSKVAWWNIDVGDEEARAVVRAIHDRRISQGEVTKAFEDALARRLGVPHVVCTTSGTMALMMAYMLVGAGPGDDVVVPNRTWVATANAALMLGARVVPVDCGADLSPMDVSRASEAITSRTKALVPVHLNGVGVDMDAVMALADRHGLPVIEDACQAFMSLHSGRPLGTFGQAGCFSLGMAKLITTGQGGFIACRDARDKDQLERIRNQGMSRYELSERHGVRGGNFKFTDVQAAIGLAQLDRLDRRVEHQKALWSLYDDALKGAESMLLLPVDVAGGETPLRAGVLCSDPDQFIEAMAARGFEVVRQAPCLNCYDFIHAGEDATVYSAVFSDHLLTLPSGPDQPLETARRAADAARAVADGLPSWADININVHRVCKNTNNK